jgi:hypothetical protein
LPVFINGKITLDFVLDSGASDVSIPADVFSTLRRTGTISENDLLPATTYRMADGSVQQQIRFRIRSLQVGGLELRGVVGSVAPARGDLLLGQSFLQRLRSWSVDNQRRVLIISEGVAENASSEPPSSAAGISDTRHQPKPDYACGDAQDICRKGASSSCKSYRNDFENDFERQGHICPGVYPDPAAPPRWERCTPASLRAGGCDPIPTEAPQPEGCTPAQRRAGNCDLPRWERCTPAEIRAGDCE